MTYVITEACIGTKDRSCVDVCPVDCIHDEGDVDQMLYIDPDECIDCGACEPACPVSAIFAEDDVPDNLKPYIEINALWYKDKEAARAKVREVHGG
ncbi:MAG TPA: ferredoxin family protein [Dehalococcoidia bacterium]|nr:ferredoxin family protein [Dehalococcoidia bacterium]